MVLIEKLLRVYNVQRTIKKIEFLFLISSVQCTLYVSTALFGFFEISFKIPSLGDSENNLKVSTNIIQTQRIR